MTLTGTRPTGPAWRTRAAFWWFALAALAVAVVAPLPYALAPLTELGRNGMEVAANYAARPTALQVAFALHVGFGGLALLLSPVQFAARLRDRAPAVHRTVGRWSSGPSRWPGRPGWSSRRTASPAGWGPPGSACSQRCGSVAPPRLCAPSAAGTSPRTGGGWCGPSP